MGWFGWELRFLSCTSQIAQFLIEPSGLTLLVQCNADFPQRDKGNDWREEKWM